MLLLALPLFFGSFLFAVAVLIVYRSDLKDFKDTYLSLRGPRITELPVITAAGRMVCTVEELDAHLEILRSELEEKESELEGSMEKMSSIEENLGKLNDARNEVKKFYAKLQSDVGRCENECKTLRDQIDDCTGRQERLRNEVTKNVKYYINMLGNITNEDKSITKDYEVIKPMNKKSSKII